MVAVCEAQCSRQQRCTPQKFPTDADKAACVPTCIAKSPSASVFRDGVLTDLAACTRDLACGTSDDVCLTNAAKPLEPDWIASADSKACAATYDACKGTPIGYVDRTCRLFAIFSPSTLSAFNACLAKPCSEVAACVEVVIPL